MTIPQTPDDGDSLPPSPVAPGSPLSDDQRRDALDRLCPPPARVVGGIEIVREGSGCASISGWHCDKAITHDDREYRCSCGLTVRIRGVVSEGFILCCKAEIKTYKKLRRRGEG